MTHAFTVNTDITWNTFVDKVLQYFKIRRTELLLGYRLTREPRKFILLTSELEWKTTMLRVRGKIHRTRYHPVAMEIKNMLVSDAIGPEKKPTYNFSQVQASASTPKARGSKKGKDKEKRCREDNIPAEALPEAKTQYENLLKLKKHLFCHAHSRGAMKAYCHIVKSSETSEGGHQDIDYEQMTLWAKLMVSNML